MIASIQTPTTLEVQTNALAALQRHSTLQNYLFAALLTLLIVLRVFLPDTLQRTTEKPSQKQTLHSLTKNAGYQAST